MKTSVRNIVLFSFLLLYSFTAYAQARGSTGGRVSVDSLKRVLAKQIADTNKVKTLFHLSRFYRWHYADSSIDYAQQALDLSETIHYEAGIFWSLSALCGASTLVGNYPMEL